MQRVAGDHRRRLAQRLDWFTVFDIDPVRSLLKSFGLELAKSRRLELFLHESLGASMVALPFGFAAFANDLNTGEKVILNHGDPALAMRASSAFAGMLVPVNVGGRLLGDGQVVSPMPVAVARQLGARVFFAVDVAYPPKDSEMTNPVSVLFQTVLISRIRHLLNERPQANRVLSPKIECRRQPGFGDREWLIQAGGAAAEAALPQLKAAFAINEPSSLRGASCAEGCQCGQPGCPGSLNRARLD